MKAFKNPVENSPAGWPHPSLDGEVAAWKRPDEHNRTGILTSGLKPSSRLPGVNQWLWEVVARYSGATVSDFHGVP